MVSTVARYAQLEEDKLIHKTKKNVDMLSIGMDIEHDKSVL